MTRHLSEALNEKIEHAESLYHRLVLVVGAEGSGKTSALRDLSECIGAPLLNVNLELSRRLLDLTERQRPFRALPLLERIVHRGAAARFLPLFHPTARTTPVQEREQVGRGFLPPDQRG